ncbi:MAG: protein kinase [Verrucomicrobia bacterium]|nr:protein kinase [Verrucomicrobiota bacterium]MBS0645646.1 protein kinase [Verrucomicrobiota bacterium]
MSVSSQSEVMIPAQIGEYRVDCLLNKGGSSEVYLGFNPKTKEPVAIKVLSQKQLANVEAAKRFLYEAELLQTANHPNIIKIFNQGRWEGGFYIAMEFVQGICLREMILQQATSLRRSIEIALQVAHAVTHLHVLGIVHRDLKPENIMLTAQGGVKLIDFGTAKFFTASEGKQGVLGTPSYMSPEQRKNPANAGFPSDIFSLGVILYELILGRLCYGSIQLSLIPKGLQSILAGMLQPDPKQRTEDIVDVVQALSLYLGSGALEKDMRGSDYIGELNEDLKESSSLLLPKQLPKWPSISLGFVSNCNLALSAVYYDFFETSNGGYSIVMGESLATGVKGLLEISMLRGMVRALFLKEQNPSSLVANLNDLLVNLDADQAFSFALLSLRPAEQRFSFISCGYNALWQIPAGSTTPRRISSNHVAIGIQSGLNFLEVDSNWAIGDALVLHTFQAGTAKHISEVEKDEQGFLAALKQNLHLAPQKQVDAIFRVITQKEDKYLLQKLVTLISMTRTL